MQTAAELREHFEIERALASRLRSAVSRDERRALYGEVYRDRTQQISHHPLVRQAADPVARSAAVQPQVRLLTPFLTPDAVFCELGAGDGAVARAVAPHVCSSLALDVTDVLALPDEGAFQFRVFDGFDLEVEDGSVDVIYSNDVVEHLHADDMLDQSSAILRALRPGGRYVCVTPNRLSGPHDVSRHFSKVAEGFHLREYTVGELADALRRAGFGRVQIVLTVAGRRLSPLLPAGVLAPVEAVLGVFPTGIRRRLSMILAAVKVVATRT